MPRTGDRRTATGEFGYIYPRPQPLLRGGGRCISRGKKVRVWHRAHCVQFFTPRKDWLIYLFIDFKYDSALSTTCEAGRAL